MELAALIAKKKVEDPEAVARLGEELAQAIAFTSREAKQRGKLATLKSFWAKQGVAVGQRSVQPDGDAHSAVVISTPTSTQVLPYHSAAQVPVHRTGSQLQEDIHDLGDVLENLNDAELARKLELYRYTLRHLYHRDMDKMSAHEFMEFVNDWEARGFWHSPEGRAVKEQWESLSQPGGAAGSRTWDEDAGYWAHGGPGASSEGQGQEEGLVQVK
ncbi:uncharacterized protein PFL1_06743 [Pseudozyma flocculosa PF-1]|uniref:Uncharacterized protein n=1 Tax=Pseudozyma flocculosa PF-1 TaxID=1277687 RepID=A0A061H4V7_9BASI|nr:uncharacterized protein PFL1_06743 [Pseudozyma flocculosa PF-1]EPQ25671.1 hypothetical protein PFL1_06743 [Pseudozyma flocculosa PF-1]